MELTENFNLSEFACKSGARFPQNVVANIMRLAEALQVIRDEVKAPISITSGYRSPEHNTKIGGAPNSTHTTGMGVDFKVNGMAPAAVAAIIERLISQGKIPQGGLKAYSSWIHYDIRGTRARW
jgi:uncharacterized protein YcbK (DUF882 family)